MILQKKKKISVKNTKEYKAVENIMNARNLIKNLIDQIKEAQIKLGYVKETLRFYYPVSSLNNILGVNYSDETAMLEALNENPGFKDTVLGMLQFNIHGGRIEISVMQEGAEYVHRNVETPPFLFDLITLFGVCHDCSIYDICRVFERYSHDYVCRKMQKNRDFDYVIFFKDKTIDEYYYCIRIEMGHTIYHRFMKEDFETLIS